MTLFTTGTFCPYIECAPCPPFFVVDIYQILVNVSLSVNLTESDYRAIAARCNIQEPTTTTTTTTTTSLTSTTQTTSVLITKMTSVANISTTTPTLTPVSLPKSSVNVSKTSDVSSTKHIPISTERIYITSSASESGVSTSLSTYLSSSTERTTTVTTGITGLTTGGSKRRHRWPYCNDVCLIIAITSSTCAFLVLLVVLALCCKRSHPHNKANSRSSSSQRLVANGTYERPNTMDRQDGVVWRYTPGIENLAYRKSLEMREPLKYMDSEQNWEDLDYVAAGKDGSLRSNKSSQRSDGSPKRKGRSNKDKRQSSTEKLNQTHGVVLIPLSDRKQRSLPKIPTETQSVNEEKEHSYPNGIRFLSLPRPPKERYAAEHIREHIRSKSDGQSRSRTKQRPRSHEHLNTHSENVYVDIPEYPRQVRQTYSKPNQIRNDLKAKDTNLTQAQNRKTKSDFQNPGNHSLRQNISHSKGPNRRFHPEDNVFPEVESSSSPKFYPPYREPNKQTVMFTTRL